MAFQTGTVNQAHGASGFLQGVLIPFLTGAPGTPGRDWTVEINQNAKKSNGADNQWGSTCKEYVLSNGGKSGSEFVFIGFREYRYPTNNEYGLELNGYAVEPTTNFYDNMPQHGLDAYDNTRDHWTEMPFIQQLDSTMTYWIYSNAARVVIVLKVASDYYSGYVGFGRRLGSIGEYPCPMFVCGSAFGNTPYTSGGRGISYMVEGNMFAINPANAYISGTDDNIQSVPFQNSPDTTPYGPAPDGRYILIPTYIVDVAAQQVLFVLDYAYGSMIINQQSEDVYNDGKYDYRIFQNGNVIDNRGFFAIKEFISTTTSTTTT